MLSKIFQIFKKSVLIFLSFSGILTLILTGVLTWIFFNPKAAWEIAQRHLLPKDFKVSWQTLDVDVSKMPGWVWHTDLKVGGLVLTKGEPKLAVHIDLISADFTTKFFSGENPLQIRNLVIKSNSAISFWQPELNSEMKTPDKSPYQIIKGVSDYLSWVKKTDAIENLEIDLRQILYFAKTKVDNLPTEVRLSVNKNDSDLGIISFGIDAKLSGLSLTQLKASGSLNASLYDTKDSFLSGKIEGIGDQLSFEVPIGVIFNQDMYLINSKTKLSFQVDKSRISAQPIIQAAVSEKQATVKISSDVTGLPGPVKDLDHIVANLTLPLQDDHAWTEAVMKFDVTAPIELSFIKKNIRDRITKLCDCEAPTTLSVEIVGSVQLDHLLNPEDKQAEVVELSLSTSNIKNKLFNLDLGAKLRILQDTNRFYYEPSLNTELDVYNFKAIAQLLDSMGILIPAPISVLNGTLHASAKGPLHMNYRNEKLGSTGTEILVDVDLLSKRQKVKLSAAAIVTAAATFKRIDISAKTKIDALEMELPPLDPILGIPRVARDTRIQMKPLAKKAPPAIKIYFDFEVETAQPNAIKLFSKLVPTSIPISIKFKKESSESPAGFLQIDPFKIVYLRRTLAVDSLKINFSEDASADFPIEGDFHVDQTAYRILIHVGGTLGAPQILLASEPYLDRGDIISVLLYDRPRNQLVGGDAETAGNVQAAMADKAIGLFGLWAFANTPIRSFTYNPITKVYAAEFQLDEGLTAGVGTAADKNTNLELRKRLSKRWVLTASWVPKEDQAASEAVSLQWEKRF